MTDEVKQVKESAAPDEVEAVAMPEPIRHREAQDLKAQMAAQGAHLSDRDMTVIQAYLDSKQKWAGLYRRLADA